MSALTYDLVGSYQLRIAVSVAGTFYMATVIILLKKNKEPSMVNDGTYVHPRNQVLDPRPD